MDLHRRRWGRSFRRRPIVSLVALLLSVMMGSAAPNDGLVTHVSVTVYVLGDVRKPAGYQVSPEITIADLVQRAGWKERNDRELRAIYIRRADERFKVEKALWDKPREGKWRRLQQGDRIEVFIERYFND